MNPAGTVVMQWLLIGGPFHGKLLNIKGNVTQIRHPHPDGEDYLYVAQTFAFQNGKQYRLGLCHSEGANKYTDDMLATLVASSGVEPMPDGAQT